MWAASCQACASCVRLSHITTALLKGFFRGCVKRLLGLLWEALILPLFQ